MVGEKADHTLVPMVGTLKRINAELIFWRDKELSYGKYWLKAKLVDRAGNVTPISDAFVVRDPQPLDFLIERYPINEYPDSDSFQFFLKTHRGELRTHHTTLYVYRFEIINSSKEAVLRNIYLEFSTLHPAASPFFQWIQLGSRDVAGAVDLHILHVNNAYHQSEMEEMFSGQRRVNIESMGPTGSYTAAVLVGFPSAQAAEQLGDIKVKGSYVYDGYGVTESVPIDLRVSPGGNVAAEETRGGIKESPVVKVTWNIYSGLPSPEWDVTDPKAIEALRGLISNLPATAPAAGWSEFGGFTLWAHVNPEPIDFPEYVAVHGGVVEIMARSDREPQFFEDRNRLEDFLLAEAHKRGFAPK